MDQINKHSTPLVVRSSQLKTALLNINRSLTPYLFTSYVDELEQTYKAIDHSLKSYHQALVWFSKAELKNSDLKKHLKSIKLNGDQTEKTLQEVISKHAVYLDVRDRSQYAQSSSAMLFQQVNNELNSQAFHSTSDTLATEQLKSQIGLIESQVKVIFSLKEPIELKPEAKSFSRREQLFRSLITDLENNNPAVHTRLQDSLNAIQTSVFSNKGAVALHLQSIQLSSQVRSLRATLEHKVDVQLADIEQMSNYATDNAKHLFELSNNQLTDSYVSIISIVLISITLAGLIGWGIARSITKPSKLINRVLDEVSDKNLVQRVNYRSNDELGQVASKVNAMISQLSEVIIQLGNSSKQLDTASVENQVTSGKLSCAIEEQTAQILQIASAIEEIEHSVLDIANASNDSFTLVTNAVACSEKGQDLMTVNTQLIQDLSSKLEVSTQSINQLSVESSSIGSILDVISNISEQTNLLALNAAIEAARAGEQGRGFAVVADEVRMLASKTTRSTIEIKQKIDTLKKSASHSVTHISACSDVMNQYTEHAGGINLSLSEVHKFLGMIEESSHQIAQATNQHKTAALEVTNNISHIHGLAQENTHSAHQLVILGEELEKMAQQQSILTKTFQL